MLAALVYLACTEDGLLSRVDALVKARDLVSLRSLLSEPISSDPFRIVGTNGAFDVGKRGWSAIGIPGQAGGDGYIVLSTPLTVQDTGELLFKVVGGKLSYIPESNTLGARIVRHDFQLRFLPAAKSAEIVDEFVVRTTKAQPWLFRMAPTYKVSRIVNEAGKDVPYRQGGGVVFVDFPVIGEHKLKVSYRGVVDLPGYSGSVSTTEATLTDDYWYPSIARIPAPYTIAIKAPATWTAVGQGEKVSEAVEGEEKVTRYRMDLPVTYYSVSAAPYRVVSRVVDGRKFTFWSLRMSEKDMELQAELFAPVLKFYERFAPYPFTGYGAVDSAAYGGGALEAYSFATYGGWLPDEDAHEPSHTWWGGILDNTYLHSMWNESFAAFCEGLYQREVPIGNASERRQAFISPAGFSPEFDVQPIEDSGVAYGGVSRELGYGKGGMVLQMLEQLLGPEKMIATMREWIVRHPKGEAADWPEFERVAIEKNPEADLAGFFKDWLQKPGHAEITASANYTAGHLMVKVHFEGETFRGPLDLMVEMANGTRLFSTQTLREFRNGTAILTLPLPGKPKLVSVDPWRRLIRRIDANETPTQLASFNLAEPTYVDPSHKDWSPSPGVNAVWPSDLTGKVVVGHPDTTPQMAELCRKAGFTVKGNELTWEGTTIHLDKGIAMAVVDLPDGKQCAISLGTARAKARTGQARTVLTDDLGRFLRGATDPKTKGNLTIQIP